MSEGADRLRLSPIDPAGGEEAEAVDLSAPMRGRLLLRFEGTGTEMLFDPARPGEAVSTDWPADTDPPLVQNWPYNAELATIFRDDQAAREPGAGKAIDWAVVGKADAARRVRTQALIDAGALHSGADYWHAAFVFQHGDTAGDYLKAHALAIAAAARGYRDGAWIAAATLDRYLQEIGKPQVFGTQFSGEKGGGLTQQPYDSALLSDGLRAAVDVPPLARQDQQRRELEARFNPRASPASTGP